MKTNCNIIKDLLPLYIDHICSEESKQLIDEHLAECKNCSKALDNMKEEIHVSSIDEKSAIKKFLGKIKKKRLIAIVLSILITFTLVVVGLNKFERTQFVVDYKPDSVVIQEQKDGELIATINTTHYTYPYIILEQNSDDTVDVYITLFLSLKDELFPTDEDKTSIAYAPKCWNNFIEENVELNCVWKNNKSNIILNTHHDVKIAHVYYLETMEKFKTILRSNETVDPAFPMINLWKNKNLPSVFSEHWNPGMITTIDIEQGRLNSEGEEPQKITINKEDIYSTTEKLHPILDIINLLNYVDFENEACDEVADYYFKINTPEKENAATYGLEIHENEYHITTVVNGKAKETVLSPSYQKMIDKVINQYF